MMLILRFLVPISRQQRQTQIEQSATLSLSLATAITATE